MHRYSSAHHSQIPFVTVARVLTAFSAVGGWTDGWWIEGCGRMVGGWIEGCGRMVGGWIEGCGRMVGEWKVLGGWMVSE